MSRETVWIALKKKTVLSDEAIAGLMGNLEAESNCESCRVQGDFTADRRVSKAYAADVNRGNISQYSFSHDQKGFGLPQFTYFSRKSNLYDYCKSIGAGIEDEEAQIDFMLSEMQNEYVTMWRQLLSCSDIRTAADLVCRQYERPAVNNVEARAEYGRQIYAQFHGKTFVEIGGVVSGQDPIGEGEWLQEWIDYLQTEIDEKQAKIDALKARQKEVR